jgi:hypothetical protein
MPVRRCGLSRARDIHTESSNGSFSNIVHGDFQPVLAKHSKSVSLLDAISVGVDRMQRNFEPMRQPVEMWRQTELSTVTAKMIIYLAFIESDLEVPKHLARRVHDSTSHRDIPSSNRGRSGAYPTCSHRLSKISIRSRSFALRPNSTAFSIHASSRASKTRANRNRV